MTRYDYYTPRTLAEAFGLAADKAGARFVAGGTDLMVRIRHKDVHPEALVSLRSIPEITGIEIGGSARIGAATTIADIARHEGLGAAFPVLVQAARRVGGPQIRNAGTIGGNLCNASPCADTALPLLALDAVAHLESVRGARAVPLRDFFQGPRATCLAPGELLSRVEIPKPAAGAKAVFLKKGRVKMDLSIASVAVLLELDGESCAKARIAAGSVAPIPLRLTGAEALLEGKRLTEDVIAAAAETAMREISPITDVRSTAEYRRSIIGVFTRRAIAALLGRGVA
jgi:CO/xanthine dehydrogenase FAD-binding subunit